MEPDVSFLHHGRKRNVAFEKSVVYKPVSMRLCVEGLYNPFKANWFIMTLTVAVPPYKHTNRVRVGRGRA